MTLSLLSAENLGMYRMVSNAKQLFQEGIKINLNIQYSVTSFLMITAHNWSIF